MHAPSPRRGTAVAVALAFASLLVALTGSAVAATGGHLVLGHANKAGRTTALTNTGLGAALRLNAHNLKTPVLSVGKNHTRIPHLNADLLDGKTSARFQRRVTGRCHAGRAITAVGATGRVTCGPRIMWAAVNADGTLARGSSGVSSSRSATGQYTVDFPVSVSNCGYTASGGTTAGAPVEPVATWTSPILGNTKGVAVETQEIGNGGVSVTDDPFFLTVVC